MLGVHLDIEPYLQRLKAEIDRVDRAEIARLADLLFEAWQQGRYVFVFGNGGSACPPRTSPKTWAKGRSAQADLKDESKRRLKVLSLTDNVGWLTALGNDWATTRSSSSN